MHQTVHLSSLLLLHPCCIGVYNFHDKFWIGKSRNLFILAVPASPPKPLQFYKGAATEFNLDKSSPAADQLRLFVLQVRVPFAGHLPVSPSWAWNCPFLRNDEAFMWALVEGHHSAPSAPGRCLRGDATEQHRLGPDPGQVSGRGGRLVGGQAEGKEGHQRQRRPAYPGPSQQAPGPGIPPGIQHGVHGEWTEGSKKGIIHTSHSICQTLWPHSQPPDSPAHLWATISTIGWNACQHGSARTHTTLCPYGFDFFCQWRKKFQRFAKDHITSAFVLNPRAKWFVWLYSLTIACAHNAGSLFTAQLESQYGPTGACFSSSPTPR